MKLRFIGWGLVCSALMYGCGGGGASSPIAEAGAGADANFGMISTRAVGGVQEPVWMIGSAATVMGVFGASFTSISANLQLEVAQNEEALLSNTAIAMSDNMKPYLIDYGTRQLSFLNQSSPNLANGCKPTFSGTGDQLATVEQEPGGWKIIRYNIDGSGRTVLTAGGNYDHPSWSPTASRIAYVLNGDIYAMNSDGTGVTNLTNTPNVTEIFPMFHPTGTKIGYWRFVNPYYEYWEMSPTGLNQTKIASVTQDLWDWDYIPGIDEIIYCYSLNNQGFVRTYNPATNYHAYVLYANPETITSVTASPTGSHYAFVDHDGSYNGQLEVRRLRDRNWSNALKDVYGWSERDCEWGPLPRRRVFVGPAGASLHTNAAGFLFGMRRDQFASMLVFDAVTRNTVDIDTTPTDGINASNQIAMISAADTITMLRYTNGLVMPRTTVVEPTQPGTHCQGALVSYDQTVGRVVAVVPFNRSRSGAKPELTQQGNRLTYSGEFLGVWDEDGKKTSGPMTSVTLDRNTGKIIN